MKELNIDYEKVDSCIEKNFDKVEENEGDFYLLERDRLNANELGVHATPALAINNKRYRGELTGDAIFKGICSSYRVNNTPQVCTEPYKVEEVKGKIEEDFVQPFTLQHHHLIFVLIFIFIFNLFLFVCCMRKKNKEENSAMKQNVQIQVEKYFALQSEEPKQ